MYIISQELHFLSGKCFSGSVQWVLTISLLPQVWCYHLWPHLYTSLYFWVCAPGGPGAERSIRCCSAVSVFCWLFSLRDTWLGFIYTSSSSFKKRFHPMTTMQGKRNGEDISRGASLSSWSCLNLQGFSVPFDMLSKGLARGGRKQSRVSKLLNNKV